MAQEHCTVMNDSFYMYHNQLTMVRNSVVTVCPQPPRTWPIIGFCLSSPIGSLPQAARLFRPSAWRYLIWYGRHTENNKRRGRFPDQFFGSGTLISYFQPVRIGLLSIQHWVNKFVKTEGRSVSLDADRLMDL